MKPGTAYEEFVGKLQQALIDSDTFMNQKNILIERNKVITDNNGINREFDLYWEYSFGGIIYKTIIECKDYSKKIDIGKIDAFIGKIHDLPGLKPVFATTIGYQKGAKTKAEKNGIELLVVREQEEKDWYDKDGNPYLKQVHINLLSRSPIRLTSFKPTIDKDWLLENTNITLEEIKEERISRSDEIIIYDNQNSETKTLQDYLIELDGIKESYGEHKYEKEFKNAFISMNDKKIKLKSIIINYFRSEPFSIPIHIDYSKELYGVIEYLSKKLKLSFFNKGKIIRENM